MTGQDDEVTGRRLSRRQTLTAAGVGALGLGAGTGSAAAMENDTVFVGPDGSDDDDGDSEAPVATVREALDRIEPGQRVYLSAGTYQESVVVTQSGTADAPIEITGPEQAVLQAEPDVPGTMLINGSHVHLTGLTLTGLSDFDAPEDPSAYNTGPVLGVMPADVTADSMLENVVVAPDRIGSSGGPLVQLLSVEGAEVGPFTVGGPAGGQWLFGDAPVNNGDIVSVGIDPATVERRDGLDEWDRSRDIEIHHVDNTAGHPHARFVNLHPGTERVTVEYCTDDGGSLTGDDGPGHAVRLQGHEATLRWCKLYGANDESNRGDGVGVGSEDAETTETDRQARAGTGNVIYRNDIRRFQQSLTFGWERQGPSAQGTICGNRIDGESPGNPTQPCGGDVPTSDDIGVGGGENAIRTDNPNDYTPSDSPMDLVLYGATALSVGALVGPYLFRRFGRR